MAIDEDDDEGGDRRYNFRRNRPLAHYREVTSDEQGSADPEDGVEK